MSGFSSTMVIFGVCGFSSLVIFRTFLTQYLAPSPEPSRKNVSPQARTSVIPSPICRSPSRTSAKNSSTRSCLTLLCRFQTSVTYLSTDYKPSPYSTIHLSGSPTVKMSVVCLSMKTLMLLSLFVNVANGCGNNTHRRISGRGTVSRDWGVTKACVERVESSSNCCYHHMRETYADPFGSDIVVKTLVMLIILVNAKISNNRSIQLSVNRSIVLYMLTFQNSNLHRFRRALGLELVHEALLISGFYPRSER